MTDSTSAAIQILNLTKIYDAQDGATIKAIDNLSLTIPRGCLFGLLGANGAGKTTLVKSMAGLVAPTSGHISLNGHPLTLTQAVTASEVGVVLAEAWPEKKLKQWTTLLQSGLLAWKASDHLEHEWAYDKQRLVDFVCILITDPPLVFVDEPLAGFEPEIARSVKYWLADLVHQHGKTVVVATEDPELVEELCDEVALISHGRLVMQRPVAELLHCPQASGYQITVKGHLAAHWRDWFDNLTMTRTEEGNTILSGAIADQAALHGVLVKVRDLALPLLSITRAKPSLANIMQSLEQAEWLQGVR